MEPSVANTMLDRLVRQPGPEQLNERDVPVLARGDLCDEGVRGNCPSGGYSVDHPSMVSQDPDTDLRVFATNVHKLRYESAARPRWTPVSPTSRRVAAAVTSFPSSVR